jgi:ribosome-binding protein aMBF1 (putative translation factor)
MEQNPKSMDTEPASPSGQDVAAGKAGSAQSGAKPDKRATTQSRARTSRVSSRSANKTVQQPASKQSSAKQASKQQKKSAKPPNGVREARIERMMSKAELARRAGLSVLTIDRVEKGLESRMDTKRKILEALGLSLADRVRVFGEEE